MRKIRIIEHITLDGVIQGFGGPEEDRDGDYAYGGWAVPLSDPAIGKAIEAAQGDRFDLLLGRHTYDIFTRYWPKLKDPMADKLNAATKFVATHRPDSLEWAPVEGLGTERRSRPGRLGKLDAYTGAASGGAGRRNSAACLPDPAGQRKALFIGQCRPARIFARQHQGRVLGCAHQHLSLRWAATDRILCRTARMR